MMTLHLFTTGGSIDKTYSTQASDFVVGPPQVSDVLHDANLALDYELTEVLRKDSLEITDAERAQLVALVVASPHRQIIITHGTDTMIQTGLALRAAGDSLADKTVVLTGAMRPAAFKDSDAPFNLGGAVIAAGWLPPGIYIVMNGRIFDPATARKDGESNRFEGQ